jgi:probable nitrogen fixation protein
MNGDSSSGASGSVTPFRKRNPLPFENCVSSILDAHDRFGLMARKSKEEKLRRHFLLEPDSVKGSGAPCGIDAGPVRRQAEVFFKAVAMALDMRSGVQVCSIVELDDEGFGRAVIYSGRLVLASLAWRQGQFGFTSMDDVCREGERLVASGLEWLEKAPGLVRMAEDN